MPRVADVVFMSILIFIRRSQIFARLIFQTEITYRSKQYYRRFYNQPSLSDSAGNFNHEEEFICCKQTLQSDDLKTLHNYCENNSINGRYLLGEPTEYFLSNCGSVFEIPITYSQNP